MLTPEGEIGPHRHMQTDPDAWLQVMAPSRAALVIAVEGVVTWDLAGRPLRSRRPALRAGPCPLQAGHARGHGHNRPP
jgi:hypothetical protein